MAAGINYTLRTETNDASVLSQSYEIKKAIPEVVEQAKKAGYNINKMAVAGWLSWAYFSDDLCLS